MTTPALTPRGEAEQQAFRTLLDCMARPGTIGRVDHLDAEDGRWAGALATLRCLLDHEVTFAVVAAAGGQPRERLLRRTGSRHVPPAEAHYILADGDAAAEAIETAQIGDLEYPERAATVVVACADAGAGPLSIAIAGPGVDGTVTVRFEGVSARALHLLAERNAGFPLGLDCIFATPDGRVVCLPRSSQITSIEEAR